MVATRSRPTLQPSKEPGHVAETPGQRGAEASFVSLVAYAKRAAQKAVRQGNTALRLSQSIAILGFCLLALATDVAHHLPAEGAVPIMVPARLVETTFCNVSSWALHQEDVEHVGRPVHVCSVATVAARAAGAHPQAQAAARLASHRTAGRLRHGFRLEVTVPSHCSRNRMLATVPEAVPTLVDAYFTQSTALKAFLRCQEVALFVSLRAIVKERSTHTGEMCLTSSAETTDFRVRRLMFQLSKKCSLPVS